MTPNEYKQPFNKELEEIIKNSTSEIFKKRELAIEIREIVLLRLSGTEILKDQESLNPEIPLFDYLSSIIEDFDYQEWRKIPQNEKIKLSNIIPFWRILITKKQI
eukprot:c17059_g2_i1.p1 GENE.c17059_g2_i1~~c17059_g2_i1.p1  ORF type:complete len:105 (+),score=44.75 c17059_g2_i1:117-431(+)